MLVNISKKLNLNKFEKVALVAIFFAFLAATTVNVIFIADMFGVPITNDISEKIWAQVTGGTGVATAIGTVLGVTVPAWAVPVLAGMGIASA